MAARPAASAPSSVEGRRPTDPQVLAERESTTPTVVEELVTAKVVHGDSLWRISRAMLGHGIRYTQIYAANTQQIRDPRLIYPGQVFRSAAGLIVSLGCAGTMQHLYQAACFVLRSSGLPLDRAQHTHA